MLDLVIRGGEVIKGTGAPAFRADVGGREGRVAEVGDLAGRSARQVIAAEGRVNEVPVVLDGEPTGAMSGRVLRRHRS